jgi:hypothetical protein
MKGNNLPYYVGLEGINCVINIDWSVRWRRIATLLSFIFRNSSTQQLICVKSKQIEGNPATAKSPPFTFDFFFENLIYCF